MNANTARHDLCSICRVEIANSKNNWVDIQWNGVKGINEASMSRKDHLVIEAGTKVHLNSRQQYTPYTKTQKVILQSKIVVLYIREPQNNQVHVLKVIKIAYSVVVRLNWTMVILDGYELTNLWRLF